VTTILTPGCTDFFKRSTKNLFVVAKKVAKFIYLFPVLKQNKQPSGVLGEKDLDDIL
jgi:hypothetical protein